VAAFAIGLILLTFGTTRAEELTVAVIATTDIHGCIYPYDYEEDKPDEVGLAKAATVIKRLRERYPNHLLLDGGDILQGTPLVDYYNIHKPSEPNPVVVAMNSLGYDAVAVGNHDFDYGLDVLRKAVRDSKFAWLSCNVLREDTGEHEFKPYLDRDVNGVPIRVIGVVTPSLTKWVEPDCYRRLKVTGVVESVKRTLDQARGPRVTVAICHTEAGPARPTRASSDPLDTGFFRVAALGGIDAVVGAHTHQEISSRLVNAAIVMQPKSRAQSVGLIELRLARDRDTWRVVGKKSWTEPVEKVEPDASVMKLIQVQHRETLRYLDEVIARSTAEVGLTDGLARDNGVIDLIHQVQLRYTHADISFASVLSTRAVIPKGDVKIRTIYAIYPYENRLYTVSMTGEQVRKYLEYAASFFGQYGGDRRLVDENKPAYNFDTAEGLSYVLDVGKPRGARVSELTIRGKELDPAKVYRVAVNSYRAQGGGGYLDAIGDVKVLSRTDKRIRDLLIEYLRSRKVFCAQATGNWRIVPPEAADRILKEAPAQH